jgi:uncharacterized protein DUF2800
MAEDHSILAPSAAPIWGNCEGSVQLSLPYRDKPETEDTMAGTAAHWLGCETARTGIMPLVEVAPNGMMITDEMRQGAEIYAEVVKAIPNCYLETRIPILRVHEQCWGTPDFFAINPLAGHLREWIRIWEYSSDLSSYTTLVDVGDYKFGFRDVEVFQHLQLVSYSAGILDTYQLNDLTTLVRFTIVQPRNYSRSGPVQTWIVPAHALRGIINILHTKAHAALQPRAATQTGEWCRDCKGRIDCPTLKSAAFNIMDFVGQADAMLSTPDDIGRELRLLHHAQKLLKARISGREEQALALLQSGKRVPFYALGDIVGHEKWTRPASEIIQLGKLYNVDLKKPDEPILPSAAKKLIDPDVIKIFTKRPTGGVKLVPDDSTQAKKVFRND